MKNIASVTGILLIILGLATFAYKGFHYTTQEKVLQIGELQVTAEKEKSIYFPPIFGGTAIVIGIVLLVVGRKSGPQ